MLESVTPIDHNEDGFPDPCEGEDLGRFDRDEMDTIEAAAPSVAGTWLTSDQETLVLVVVDDAQGTRERLAAGVSSSLSGRGEQVTALGGHFMAGPAGTGSTATRGARSTSPPEMDSPMTMMRASSCIAA